MLWMENRACEQCNNQAHALRAPCPGSITHPAPRYSEETSSSSRSALIPGAVTHREKTWVVCKSTFLCSVIPLCPQKANIPWIFIEERVFFCSAPVPVSAVPQGDGSTGGEEPREGQVEQGMPPCLRINGAEEQCDAGMASLRVTIGLFPASAPICGFPCPTEDVLGALDLWVPARHQMGLSFDDNPSAAPWRRAI